MRTAHILAAALTLALSGCAADVGGGRVSPLRAQADDFKVTVAQGALAGAVIGGAIGYVAGNRDPKRVVTGALAGAAVGGAAGYMIAGEKQHYARKEDAYNALINDCRQRTGKLTRILATTDQLIAQRRAELHRIRALASSDTQRLTAQKTLLADLEADRAALNDALTSARQHGQEMESNLAELQKQFPGNNKQIEDEAVQYRVNAQKLEQRPEEMNRLIIESSKLT
jgi:surface antigen